MAAKEKRPFDIRIGDEYVFHTNSGGISRTITAVEHDWIAYRTASAAGVGVGPQRSDAGGAAPHWNLQRTGRTEHQMRNMYETTHRAPTR
jgi:hypothetical protein